MGGKIIFQKEIPNLEKIIIDNISFNYNHQRNFADFYEQVGF